MAAADTALQAAEESGGADEGEETPAPETAENVEANGDSGAAAAVLKEADVAEVRINSFFLEKSKSEALSLTDLVPVFLCCVVGFPRLKAAAQPRRACATRRIPRTISTRLLPKSRRVCSRDGRGQEHRLFPLFQANRLFIFGGGCFKAWV